MAMARGQGTPLSERVVANLLDQNGDLRRQIAELRQENAALQQKLAQASELPKGGVITPRRPSGLSHHRRTRTLALQSI